MRTSHIKGAIVMIQENYKLWIEEEDDCCSVMPKLEELLLDLRHSVAYSKAKSVYIKLLTARIPTESAKKISNKIAECLPKAIIAGMSLTLFGREADHVFLDMNCCYFEESSVTLLEHVGRPDHYKTAGRKYGRRISEMEHVKGVEIFCAGLNIDVSRFVEGVTEENSNIPFFGALAGVSLDRYANVEENYIGTFSNDTPTSYFIIGSRLYEAGIVMVVFCGEELHIRADYVLGWKPLGKELEVTESVTRTCISKIDNMPATEIYKKYLNVLPDDNFLKNICEFPLLVERNGCLLARVPPRYSYDGKIYFKADINAGEKLRLSYANPYELLRETKETSDLMWDFHPQAIFLCICGYRTLFLKEDAPQEVEDYSRFQTNLVINSGLGEIYRHHNKGGVLNCAFVAVGIREGAIPYSTYDEAPAVRSVGGSGTAISLTARLATFLEVTTRELKASNEELREMADAAKSASIAKSQFLSNMSHEIRTPINAILGMDEMILRESSNPAILEYAENIRMAGNNLLSLINDILDFSKIESGKMDIIPVEYAISSVLNDLVNMIQNRAHKKGIKFEVKVAHDIPSILFGDEIRIRQIITNILTNAVKYTEKGSVTLIVDYTPKDANTILLWVGVKDTGIGIKEDDLNKLFKAFERIEEKRNRAVEGTGLGMNISQQLLTLMGTKLDVQSTYGKGSTFSFMLEQKVLNWEQMGNFEESYRHAVTHREKYQEKFIAPNACILVVDDTSMNLTVVKGLLKQTKIQIDTAESGYECLNMVRRKKYDIIFLDHRMPGIDGIETLHQMKVLEGNLNIDTPVISLTANAISGAREEYISAGFKDYLTKPINSAQLELTILKFLPPEKISTSEEAEDSISEDGEITPLPQWLNRVEGLNTPEGIKHCGSIEAYLDALTVFAESILPGAKEITEFYLSEDWKNYTTKVHALKSSARIIGAFELSDRAKRLEDAGNSGYIEEIKAWNDDLIRLYKGYAAKLEPLIKKDVHVDTEKPPIDDAALSEAYEALNEVSLSYDYDSFMFVLKSLDEYQLPEEAAHKHKQLKAAASKPDWDEIHRLLKT